MTRLRSPPTPPGVGRPTRHRRRARRHPVSVRSVRPGRRRGARRRVDSPAPAGRRVGGECLERVAVDLGIEEVELVTFDGIARPWSARSASLGSSSRSSNIGVGGALTFVAPARLADPKLSSRRRRSPDHDPRHLPRRRLGPVRKDEGVVTTERRRNRRPRAGPAGRRALAADVRLAPVIPGVRRAIGAGVERGRVVGGRRRTGSRAERAAVGAGRRGSSIRSDPERHGHGRTSTSLGWRNRRDSSVRGSSTHRCSSPVEGRNRAWALPVERRARRRIGSDRRNRIGFGGRDGDLREVGSDLRLVGTVAEALLAPPAATGDVGSGSRFGRLLGADDADTLGSCCLVGFGRPRPLRILVIRHGSHLLSAPPADRTPFPRPRRVSPPSVRPSWPRGLRRSRSRASWSCGRARASARRRSSSVMSPSFWRPRDPCGSHGGCPRTVLRESSARDRTSFTNSLRRSSVKRGERQADRNAVVRRVQPEVGVLDGPLDGCHGALVERADHQQPGIGHGEAGELLERARWTRSTRPEASRSAPAGPAGPNVRRTRCGRARRPLRHAIPRVLEDRFDELLTHRLSAFHIGTRHWGDGARCSGNDGADVLARQERQMLRPIRSNTQIGIRLSMHSRSPWSP